MLGSSLQWKLPPRPHSLERTPFNQVQPTSALIYLGPVCKIMVSGRMDFFLDKCVDLILKQDTNHSQTGMVLLVTYKSGAGRRGRDGL